MDESSQGSAEDLYAGLATPTDMVGALDHDHHHLHGRPHESAGVAPALTLDVERKSSHDVRLTGPGGGGGDGDGGGGGGCKRSDLDDDSCCNDDDDDAEDDDALVIDAQDDPEPVAETLFTNRGPLENSAKASPLLYSDSREINQEADDFAAFESGEWRLRPTCETAEAARTSVISGGALSDSLDRIRDIATAVAKVNREEQQVDADTDRATVGLERLSKTDENQESTDFVGYDRSDSHVDEVEQKDNENFSEKSISAHSEDSVALNLEDETDLEDEPRLDVDEKVDERLVGQDECSERSVQGDPGKTEHPSAAELTSQKEEDALSALNNVLDILCKVNHRSFDACDEKGHTPSPSASRNEDHEDFTPCYRDLYDNLSSGESSLPNDTDSNSPLIDDLLEAASEVSSGEDDVLKSSETFIDDSGPFKGITMVHQSDEEKENDPSNGYNRSVIEGSAPIGVILHKPSDRRDSMSNRVDTREHSSIEADTAPVVNSASGLCVAFKLKRRSGLEEGELSSDSHEDSDAPSEYTSRRLRHLKRRRRERERMAAAARLASSSAGGGPSSLISAAPGTGNSSHASSLPPSSILKLTKVVVTTAPIPSMGASAVGPDGRIIGPRVGRTLVGPSTRLVSVMGGGASSRMGSLFMNSSSSLSSSDDSPVRAPLVLDRTSAAAAISMVRKTTLALSPSPLREDFVPNSGGVNGSAGEACLNNGSSHVNGGAASATNATIGANAEASAGTVTGLADGANVSSPLACPDGVTADVEDLINGDNSGGGTGAWKKPSGSSKHRNYRQSGNDAVSSNHLQTSLTVVASATGTTSKKKRRPDREVYQVRKRSRRSKSPTSKRRSRSRAGRRRRSPAGARSGDRAADRRRATSRNRSSGLRRSLSRSRSRSRSRPPDAERMRKSKRALKDRGRSPERKIKKKKSTSRKNKGRKKRSAASVAAAGCSGRRSRSRSRIRSRSRAHLRSRSRIRSRSRSRVRSSSRNRIRSRSRSFIRSRTRSPIRSRTRSLVRSRSRSLSHLSSRRGQSRDAGSRRKRSANRVKHTRRRSISSLRSLSRSRSRSPLLGSGRESVISRADDDQNLHLFVSSKAKAPVVSRKHSASPVDLIPLPIANTAADGIPRKKRRRRRPQNKALRNLGDVVVINDSSGSGSENASAFKASTTGAASSPKELHHHNRSTNNDEPADVAVNRDEPHSIDGGHGEKITSALAKPVPPTNSNKEKQISTKGESLVINVNFKKRKLQNIFGDDLSDDDICSGPAGRTVAGPAADLNHNKNSSAARDVEEDRGANKSEKTKAGASSPFVENDEDVRGITGASSFPIIVAGGSGKGPQTPPPEEDDGDETTAPSRQPRHQRVTVDETVSSKRHRGGRNRRDDVYDPCEPLAVDDDDSAGGGSSGPATPTNDERDQQQRQTNLHDHQQLQTSSNASVPAPQTVVRIPGLGSPLPSGGAARDSPIGSNHPHGSVASTGSASSAAPHCGKPTVAVLPIVDSNKSPLCSKASSAPTNASTSTVVAAPASVQQSSPSRVSVKIATATRSTSGQLQQQPPLPPPLPPPQQQGREKPPSPPKPPPPPALAPPPVPSFLFSQPPPAAAASNAPNITQATPLAAALSSAQSAPTPQTQYIVMNPYLVNQYHAAMMAAAAAAAAAAPTMQAAAGIPLVASAAPTTGLALLGTRRNDLTAAAAVLNRDQHHLITDAGSPYSPGESPILNNPVTPPTPLSAEDTTIGGTSPLVHRRTQATRVNANASTGGNGSLFDQIAAGVTRTSRRSRNDRERRKHKVLVRPGAHGHLELPGTEGLTDSGQRPAVDKERYVRMDESQMKILDEMPSSAVELQVKEKYLQKLHRQERVVDEVKHALKPFYNKKQISKDDYKVIMKKCVPKICHNKNGEINPSKIKALVEGYVKRYRHLNKKRRQLAAQVSQVQPALGNSMSLGAVSSTSGTVVLMNSNS